MKITTYVCDYCGEIMEYPQIGSVHFIKDGFNLDIEFELCDSCYGKMKEELIAKHKNAFKNFVIKGFERI